MGRNRESILDVLGNLALEHFERIAIGCEDRHLRVRRPRQVLVAAPFGVDAQASDAGLREVAVDRARHSRDVEWSRQLRDVDGVVRVRGAPAQHGGLEQVETPLHDALGRACAR